MLMGGSRCRRGRCGGQLPLEVQRATRTEPDRALLDEAEDGGDAGCEEQEDDEQARGLMIRGRMRDRSEMPPTIIASRAALTLGRTGGSVES